MKPETNGTNEERETAQQQPGVATVLDEATLLELERDNSGVLTAWREPWAARLAGRMGRHHAALMVISTLVLWLVVALPSWRGVRDVEVGKPAPRDIAS